MNRRGRTLFGIDAGIAIGVIAVLAGSITLLATAIVRPSGGLDQSFAHKQAIFAVIGFGMAFVVSRVPIGFWQRFWPHALVLSVAGVLLVKFLGTFVPAMAPIINGSRRWINLPGPFDPQPSEFGKVLALVAIAGFLASRHREIRDGRVFATGLAMMAVPAAVVFSQPDFGTAQVYGWLALGALFFAGARWLHFAMLGGAVIAISVLVLGIFPAVTGQQLVHDYQIKRLTGFLDPEADPQGTNYQTIQAKVAIGSGGVAGRGDGQASQVQQGFLPEPQTDFIFATLVERYGFLGGVLLLGTYGFLISRIFSMVASAATPFSRLIVGGVGVLLTSQVVINVGMVIGVLPITGVPLPMFSYGGSAIMTNMVAIGLVISALRESETPNVRYQRRTGRPVGGYGSLRAQAGESTTAGAGRRRGAAQLVPFASPLVGGTAKRRRKRRPTGR
ncbi:MAG: rod shape-determining protein RodA [Thermoleophilia bacterium]|nr:rod shape-determining protein RodA [Thermoleophilia bacterium]